MEIPNIIKKEELEDICTSDDSEFERFKDKPDKFKILLSPFNSHSIQPTSYDISVGEVCKNLTTGKEINIKEKGSVVISPNECVVITTRETIGIPLNCTALVTTKVSLSMVGIFQVTSRIDPGFKGKLDISLLNASKRNVSLRYEDSFANLIFLVIGTPASKGYTGSPKAKVTDDYRPVLEDEIRSDREGTIKSLLKSGHPFDVIAHLFEIQRKTFDEKIQSITKTFSLENRILKLIIAILLVILGATLSGRL